MSAEPAPFKRVPLDSLSEPGGAEPEPVQLDRTVDGAAFLLDDPFVDLAPRWGRSNGEIAWARGEPLLIVGPTGVGKTTLATQLVAALIGLQDEVLGMAVEPCERLLYFALDRPRQITRAMRRSLGTEANRQVLTDRLAVWRGPLPSDIGKRPELLAEIAKRHGADTVVVDSLKDLTAKVADDESGSNVNRAMQQLVADEIDVVALHHQRKGQDGRKPKTLEDVYGSTWLTAGAGSVLLLWGEAGSELVDLEHLKQPADPVGPLKLEHDHHAGRTVVAGRFDALAFLRKRAGGATLGEVAEVEWGGKPTDANRKRTQRNLQRLARDGLVLTPGARQQGTGGAFEAGRYYAAELGSAGQLAGLGTEDTTEDTAP